MKRLSRLRIVLETERQTIKDLTTRELQQLGANLRRAWSNDLRTIESDMGVATGWMRALLLNAWLRPLMVGLSLLLVTYGGAG